MTQRIGIFGGSFDPIHQGHRHIVDAVYASATFSSIEWVLSANPPHKLKVNVSAEHRLRMMHLALKDAPAYRVNDIEVKRKNISYTYHTIMDFREHYPLAVLSVVMGADSLATLATWYRVQYWLPHVHIIAIHRPGYLLKLPRILADLPIQYMKKNRLQTLATTGVSFFEHPGFNVSSTKIRENLQQSALDTSALQHSLHHDVLDYILQQKLYKKL